MPKPVIVGWNKLTETVRGLVARANDGTERTIYDSDGYLYAGGIKIDQVAVTKTFRLTVAQVNAGYELIAPWTSAGKWQVTDVWVRAIGGNAGAVTSVDIKEETSGNIVCQVPVASLLQNAVVRPGDANVVSTYLGLSSTAGKKLNIIKNGSDITTATHIDVCITYLRPIS